MEYNCRMPLNPSGEFVVRTEEEWDLVASETWVEVYGLLSAGTPMTAAEIARHLGRTRQNAYYHLHKLQAVGLVSVVDHRPAPRRPEAVFGLTTPRVRLDHDPTDPASVERLIRAYNTLFRSASRALARAAHAGALDIPRDRRQWLVYKDTARLLPHQASRVRTLILEIAAVLDEARDTDSGEPWTVLCASLPMVR